MSREEIKTAINDLLDKTSDNVLSEVRDYLKLVKDKSAQTVILSQNLQTILTENKELLERLAG